MSFDERPNVDRFSENEDESNTRFRLHFSQRNGFLVSKPEDKGCDFIVELKNNGKSTNWWFPVQLKSIESPFLIKDGTNISYSFETSRLGYMLEAIPPVGLILLYSTETNKLYYDYAENIYNRVLETRDSNMAWKLQKYVNIHIPLLNEINERSVAEIHGYLIIRHQNSSDRSPSLYPRTPIPAQTRNKQEETHSYLTPADILRSEGLDMYYNNEIPKIIQLLDKTEIKILREDARLSLLAGIAYWATGMSVDASFFLEKALNNRSISCEEREYAIWMKFFVDRHLGKISIQDYNQKVKSLLEGLPARDEIRRLKYELCIARNNIELIGPGNMAGIFDLANQFHHFNNLIAFANIDTESKIQYYLENVTNHGLLAAKCDSAFRWKIRDDVVNNRPVDPELIAEFGSLTSRLINDVEYVFPRIKPLARNFVHSVMLAKCFESQVSIQLMLDCNGLRYPIRDFDFQSEAHKRKLTLHADFAKEALHIFWEHHLYPNTYNVTLMLLELNEFAAHSDVVLDIDQDAMRQKANWLEQRLGLQPRQLKVPLLIETYKKWSALIKKQK